MKRRKRSRTRCWRRSRSIGMNPHAHPANEESTTTAVDEIEFTIATMMGLLREDIILPTQLPPTHSIRNHEWGNHWHIVKKGGRSRRIA
jgi:hypothetical protein